MNKYLSFLLLTSITGLIALLLQIAIICVIGVIQGIRNKGKTNTIQVAVFGISKLAMQIIGCFISIQIVNNFGHASIFGIFLVFTIICALLSLFCEPIYIGINIRKQQNILDKQNMVIAISEFILAIGNGLFWLALASQ